MINDHPLSDLMLIIYHNIKKTAKIATLKGWVYGKNGKARVSDWWPKPIKYPGSGGRALRRNFFLKSEEKKSYSIIRWRIFQAANGLFWFIKLFPSNFLKNGKKWMGLKVLPYSGHIYSRPPAGDPASSFSQPR
jgi:hypothetical protein